MTQNKIRICLIGLFPFPFGGGALSSRLRSFALGLQNAGALVNVLSIESTINNKSDANYRNFSWRGIDCECYYTVSRRPGKTKPNIFNLINNAIKRSLSYCNEEILNRINFLCENGLIDSVILYNAEPLVALKLSKICKKNNIIFLQQYAELHLLRDFKNNKLNSQWIREQIIIRLMPSRCDGNIVISAFQEKVCKKFGGKNNIVIPSLTNTEKSTFRGYSDTKKGNFVYFTYLGKGERRDCVDLIINAVDILSKYHLNFKISLIGLSDKNVQKYKAKIITMHLEELFIVRGRLSDDEISQIFSNSDVFLLLRSDDQSSWACFPTRLPEYLSCAKPVILSTVGDFPMYFSNMNSAILVEPGNEEAIAEKMLILINNPSLRENIGLQGSIACDKYFNYLHECSRLFEFISSTINKSIQNK